MHKLCPGSPVGQPITLAPHFLQVSKMVLIFSYTIYLSPNTITSQRTPPNPLQPPLGFPGDVLDGLHYTHMEARTQEGA